MDGIAELYEAGQPEAFARAIAGLMVDDERSEELALLGNHFTERNLNRERGREKYLAWVDKLLGIGKNRYFGLI